MTLRADIPNLAQGISKQSPSTKEFNRPRVQSNFHPHPVLGLMDRPPSQFISYPGDESADPLSYWDLIEMREDEQYYLRVSNSGVRVWGVDGEEYPVVAPSGFGYLAAVNSADNILVDPQDFTTVNWLSPTSSEATIASGSPIGGAYTEVTATLATTVAALQQTVTGVTYVEDTPGSSRSLGAVLYIKAPTDLARIYTYSVSFLDGSSNGFGITASLDTSGNWTALPAGTGLSQVDSVAAEDQGNGWCKLSLTATALEGQVPAGSSGSLVDISFRIDYLAGAGATGDQLKFGVWGAFVQVGSQDPPEYLLPPDRSFKTLSAKDSTYILNTNRKVEMTSTASDDEEVGTDSTGTEFPIGDGKTWAWVRQANYSSTYRISGRNMDNGSHTTTVDWNVGAAIADGNNQDPGRIAWVQTDKVAHQLAFGGVAWKDVDSGTSLVTAATDIDDWFLHLDAGERPNFLALGGSTDPVEDSFSTGIFTVNAFGAVIQFSALGNKDFVELPRGDSSLPDGLVIISRTVRSLADLPVEGFQGKKVIVSPDQEVGSPQTYYKFVVENPDSSNADAGTGVWEETYGFNLDLEIDQDTMPHLLTRKVDDSSGTATGIGFQTYFEFAPVDWDDRIVGDEDSAPTPSFVSTANEDRYIKNLFFYRNRLGILSKDNIILSETGRFTNFFKTTTEQLVTTDPIDVRVNSRKVREFLDTFETQGRLYVRAEDTIFEVDDSGQLLSEESIQVRPRIDIHSDGLAEPIVLENTTLLTDRLQRYSQLSELYAPQRDRLAANRITDEVLDLIVPRLQHITHSASLGLLCCVPEASTLDDPSPTLFMYSYLWQGTQKVQSAWWTIDFGENDTVRHAEFFEDVLYLVMERSGEVFFTKIVFDMPKQTGSTWEVLCDDRVSLSDLTITESGGDSTITCPWPVDESYTYYIVYDGTGSEDKGDRVNEAVNAITPDASAGEIEVTGLDLTSASGYLGVRYNRTFTFDEFRPKAPANNRGRVAISNAEVSLHELILNYKDTVEFKVETTNRRTYTQAVTYEGTGDPVLSTGTERFPIYGDASRTTISIKNTSPRPSILDGGEVVFSLRARGRESSL